MKRPSAPTPTRITELSEAPVVGEVYLVPTVTHPWCRHVKKPKAWPVFLPRHEDARFFGFTDDHYHVDPRFVSASDAKSVEGSWYSRSPEAIDFILEITQSKPLAYRGVELAEPVWRPRRCHRSHARYVFGSAKEVSDLRRHYAGQVALRNRHGWVCPHQHAALGSVAPDRAGVITCPLHGLRISASDGLCLGDGANPESRLP